MLSDGEGSADPDIAWMAPQVYLRMVGLAVGGGGKPGSGSWPLGHMLCDPVALIS